MKYLIAYLATLVTFSCIDTIWIVTVVRKLYENEVGVLLRDSARVGPAIIFYLVYAAGIVLLAVRQGLTQDSMAVTAMYGAICGVFAYGTYSLTNYSVMTQWTASLVASDIAWGAFLTAMAASVGHLAARSIG